MTSLPKVGLNLSDLGNTTDLNFTINTSIKGFLEELPRKSNELTGGYFGGFILVFVSTYLYKILSDKSEYGGFRFSKLRSVGIATGIAGSIGLVMLNIGYFVNLYHVYVFLTIFLIICIWISKEEK